MTGPTRVGSRSAWRGWILPAGVALLCALSTGGVSAQEYPNRPLRLLAPYGAGGSYDGLARVIAAKLGEQLGQQVIVDNRAGASGRIGMALAIRMPADGYNLLILGNTQAVVPSIRTSSTTSRGTYGPSR
jgi:tripartite-type tricarboxylate transporter receptor subunit TctC